MSSKKDRARNKKTKTWVLLRKRKSIKEKIKKMEKDKSTQMTCLPKKFPTDSAGVKDFMVSSPAVMIGKIKKTSTKSILLRTFSAMVIYPPKFFCNLLLVS